MKRIQWKTLFVTSLACLLPILLGIALWDQLPDLIPIHFNFYGEPDNFASKPFAIFGFAALMVVMHVFCCLVYDLSAEKQKTPAKLVRLVKWIIPVMALILQPVIFFYALGWNIDIRRVTVFLVGCLLIMTGNYLPKMDHLNNIKVSPDKARKINRFLGFETVIMGALMLLSIFLPPIASVIALILLIPYTLLAIIYAIIVGRKKDEVV
ncbi:MAG: DUF1648 domain-containing protein [Oscillospiraceae bacterium]|nr:DUF1648 domain-containing protein [Oscillospiraceae bacterium]